MTKGLVFGCLLGKVLSGASEEDLTVPLMRSLALIGLVGCGDSYLSRYTEIRR